LKSSNPPFLLSFLPSTPSFFFLFSVLNNFALRFWNCSSPCYKYTTFQWNMQIQSRTTNILQGDHLSTVQCHFQAPEYSTYKRKHLPTYVTTYLTCNLA
jgi:hypothetical protein